MEYTKYQKFPYINEYIKLLEYNKSVKTITTYRDSINKFFDYLNIKNESDISSIKTSNLIDFLSNLKLSMKPRSVNSHFRNIKALFRWLQGKKYIEEDIFFNLKELQVETEEDDKRKNQEYIEYEESKKIIKACKNLRDKTMMALTISLGLRRCELTRLNIDSYFDGKLRITGKKNKVRTLPLEPNLKNSLEEYISKERNNNKSGDPLFFSNKNTRFSGTAINLKLDSILERTNLSQDRKKAIHPHTMRHTFGTDLRESSGDIRKVQAAMGHASMQTTMIYDHVRDKIISEAILNKRSVLSD
jgi:site-specific recombinase XerD